MIALALLGLYAFVAIVITLLAVTTKADDDTPIGLAVAAGMLWLPLIVAVVLIAGVASLLRGRP